MKSTKRIKPSEKSNVTIALDSPVVQEENLPLTFVHYPNHYGTFIGFSKDPNDKTYFCSCSKSSIENHFKLNQYELENNWGRSLVFAPLSSHFFPNHIAELSKIENLASVLSFKDKICHRCNLSTPSLRYCHEMYGGNFKQFYGWYISQTSLRLGVRDLKYVNDFAAPELVKLIDEAKGLLKLRSLYTTKGEEMDQVELGKTSELDKKISKQERELNKQIEDFTRIEFGFRKIGEGNVSETILSKIVSKIFEGEHVIIHHRPKWLEGLELDIYLPNRKLGIEYQGQQHFHPIKAWGGQSALDRLRERDSRKRILCIQHGVNLLEVDYTEPLSYDYIKEKVCAKQNLT